MTDKELTNYIRHTLESGFPENRIRETLLKAGWTGAEVQEGFSYIRPQDEDSAENSPVESKGFFARYEKMLIIILAVLIGLPLIGFAGYFAYQKFVSPKDNAGTTQDQSNSPFAPQNQTAATPTEDELALNRDKQRVKDISSLQATLDKYFTDKKFYPLTLDELRSGGYMAAVPLDPKTGRPYLYTPIEQVPLHYSISFLLEKGVGTLSAGLQTATSEIKIPAAEIQQQEELIKGAITQNISKDIQITDLSKTPFYPREEVRLDVQLPPSLNITSVHLIVGKLELANRARPFGFNFSAPSAPGNYQVNVFAFDVAGNSYYQQTSLTVKAK